MLFVLVAAVSSCPTLRVIYAPTGPDLINATAQQDNVHGIEDGIVVRAASGFYMIVCAAAELEPLSLIPLIARLRPTLCAQGAEMYGDPKWVKMRLGVWRSKDGVHDWTRQRTLRNSSAIYNGTDQHAASWGPFLLWDPDSSRWALSYIGYRSGGSNFSGWSTNWDGKVFFQYANVTGDAGLDSDFGDSGDWRSDDQVLLAPDTLGAPWPPCQGLQGTDSMYPYQLPNGSWAALVGTSHQVRAPQLSTCLLPAVF